MSSEEDRKAERLFDKRTLERNLRKGLVSVKDLEKRNSALPDVKDKIAPPPADLPFSPTPIAAVLPAPTYIVSNGRRDSLSADLDDEDEDEDFDDEEDEEDEDEDEDEGLDDEKGLPEAG